MKVVIIFAFSSLFSTITWAKEVVLIFKGKEPVNIINFIESKGIDVVSYSEEDLNNDSVCSKTTRKVLGIGDISYIKIMKICPHKNNILGVFISNRHFQFDENKIIRSPGNIEQNIAISEEFGLKVGVIYEFKSEIKGIENKENLNLLQSSSSQETLLLIKRFYGESSSIVIGGSSNILNDKTAKIFGRISIKYKIPIIGGYNASLLKKGITAGYYADNLEILNAVINWIKTDKLIEIKIKRQENANLMEYFGN